MVQAGSQERLAAIDLALWTYKEDSFLAHGSAKDGHAAEQPVYLTTTGETPNGAGVRFLVDGAEAEAFSGFVRIVYMFDGNDAEAVKVARGAMDGGQKRRLSGDLLAAERRGQVGAQGLAGVAGKKKPRGGSAGLKASGGDGELTRGRARQERGPSVLSMRRHCQPLPRPRGSQGNRAREFFNGRRLRVRAPPLTARRQAR